MNIHEYQARELFGKFGVATQPGRVASTPEEAEKVAAELGKRYTLTLAFPGRMTEEQRLTWLIDGRAPHQPPRPILTFNAFAQERVAGDPELDAMGVPRVGDYAKSEDDKTVLDLVYAQERFGRPYVMATEVPPERVAAMRKAFMAMARDPAFLAEAKKLNLDVDASSGEEVQALVKKVFATPAHIVELAKKATAAE